MKAKSPPPPGYTAPESPTTARPLEMDDDDFQEPGLTGEESSQKALRTTATTMDAPASGEPPPPKPPRPTAETQQNEKIKMLQEAFPSIEPSVVRAVLTASGGRIEPAFNALLQMTDPDAAQLDQPPPPPPRPVAGPLGNTSTTQAQLEADELYARQLAEHYENVGAYEQRTARSQNRGRALPRGRQQAGLDPDQDDREYSFIDDELPVIKENLRKGFVETQNKFNSWITTLKKRIDGQFDERPENEPGHGSDSFIGRPTRDQSRRSAEYDRYDADPELLSDDFAGMKFHNDGSRFPALVSKRHRLSADIRGLQRQCEPSRVLTYSSLRRRPNHPGRPTDARSLSARAWMTSMRTRHRRGFLPKTRKHPSASAQRRRQASGSLCRPESLTRLQRTTPSAWATARTIRTSTLAKRKQACRTPADSGWRHLRPWLTAWWRESLRQMQREL